MAGVYGVDQSKKFVVAVAESANIVSSVFGGAGLWALVGIVAPINELKAVDFPALSKELTEYDSADRLAVESAFKGALALKQPAAQAAILAGIGELDKAVSLVGAAIVLANDAISLVAEVRKMLGI